MVVDPGCERSLIFQRHVIAGLLEYVFAAPEQLCERTPNQAGNTPQRVSVGW